MCLCSCKQLPSKPYTSTRRRNHLVTLYSFASFVPFAFLVCTAWLPWCVLPHGIRGIPPPDLTDISWKNTDKVKAVVDASFSDNIVFPTLDDTLEMASLSSMVYAFHKEDYGNSDLDNHVCERINTGNYTIINDRIVPKGIHCHWYHHDWTGGVQVMIVSSEVKQYVAVVFAGTDDFRTSITDVNIRMTEFGSSSGVTADENRNNYVMDPPSPYPVYNVSLPDPKIRVHAGFDHAVFDRNLFGEVVVRVESIRKPDDRILTTGHSLGAANAVLTAVGFIQYYEQVRQQEHRSNDENNVHQASSEAASSRVLPPVPDRVVSINFGCPQTGNTAWRDFLHTDAVIKRRLSIWRFVLGWDLVPRLPEVLQHVGHTVQLSYSSYTAEEANQTASAYYHHIGNETMQLAGVPFGWGAKPFVWVPGAIFSHVMNRYCKFLIDCNNNKNNNNNHRSSSDQQRQPWVDSFVRVNGDERPLPNVDDDFYVEPPDDDALDVQMQ